MILYYDICAFIILILVFSSCLFRRMFHGRLNRMFFALIAVIMLATLGDFGAAFMQNYGKRDETSRFVEYAWEYLYFIMHNSILFIYLPFIYASIGMWYEFVRNKKILIIWLSYFAVNMLTLFSNFFYPTVFYIDENLVYSRRPAVIVFYLTGFFFVLYQIATLIKYKSIIRKDKYIVILLMYPIGMLGIAMQVFFLNQLIEMFMISITVLLFSLIIRRDEEMIDPITGAKKYSSAHEYIKNVLATKTPVYILLIKFVNYKNLRLYLGEELLNKFMRTQSYKLSTFIRYNSLEGEIYYLEDGLYSFITENIDYEKVKKMGVQVKNHYMDTISIEDFSVIVDARLCILRCPEDIGDFNTLYTFSTSYQRILPEVKDVMNYPDYVDDREFKIKSELNGIIERALEFGCFEMFYQPIYSIYEKRFVAAEAFIRLRDETYGLIAPSLFISAAEISGAIHSIGDFVLEDVCRFISENDLEEIGLKCVQVNMSTSQCIEINLVDKIERLLKKYDIDTSYINFEITESAVDFDPDVVDNNISRLSDMGIHFALDDYGTGYSNIKRVTTLPVEIVKLDKTFVDGVDDPQMWIMVQNTIKMLKQMGKKVLVEGVEEEKVVKKFMDLGADYIQGCEYLQGYYFCRPLPEKDFLEFMKEQVNKNS
ncbi:MAG: EAL domain-containing protein [Lachnospiraceae bacterium]|nr:EAL domain-containing protein [Lachnospiraceae bacterium]